MQVLWLHLSHNLWIDAKRQALKSNIFVVIFDSNLHSKQSLYIIYFPLQNACFFNFFYSFSQILQCTLYLLYFLVCMLNSTF